MAYTSWSVVFGEQPSAAKWNILGTNDSSFNDGTGIADSAIKPKALFTGTGSTWSWTAWTPTLTGLTLGNGSLAGCKYIQIGKTVHFRFNLTFGSTSAVTAAGQFTLPVTSIDYNTGASTLHYTNAFGVATFKDDSAGAVAHGPCMAYDTTHATLDLWLVNGTYTSTAAISAVTPFTWTTSDSVAAMGTYEAA